MDLKLGVEMHNFAKLLWKFNRSLTGPGVRDTLLEIKNLLPTLQIKSINSGERAFDWTIPKEWRVEDAYIITPNGEKICNFKDNNLHLVGYSVPIDTKLALCDLKKHLHSLPEQPDAIPYVTSYYNERWGFCIKHSQLKTLKDGEYRVVIESSLFDGVLNYGELVLNGELKKEVFLSTYICHPSMANNELSGPVVTTFLAKWLMLQKNKKYTYRIIFIPETIGSIAYLSQNILQLKDQVIAGYNITCIGDDRTYSYLPSRHGDTVSDNVAKHVLKWIDPNYIKYNWNDRGSDERQYCAPGVDLPIATIMRTKYGMYEEYHTSLDNLVDVVTPSGLVGGYDALKKSLEAIERNGFPRVTVLCEPQLGKRGLYPTMSTKKSGKSVRLMMNLITWSDGKNSLIEIANKCGVPVWDLYLILDSLIEHRLITLVEE